MDNISSKEFEYPLARDSEFWCTYDFSKTLCKLIGNTCCYVGGIRGTVILYIEINNEYT